MKKRNARRDLGSRQTVRLLNAIWQSKFIFMPAAWEKTKKINQNQPSGHLALLKLYPLKLAMACKLKIQQVVYFLSHTSTSRLSRTWASVTERKEKRDRAGSLWLSVPGTKWQMVSIVSPFNVSRAVNEHTITKKPYWKALFSLWKLYLSIFTCLCLKEINKGMEKEREKEEERKKESRKTKTF